MDRVSVDTKNRRALIASPLQGARGFTLIELLVVIAIIGVLAHLGQEAYSVYRQKAYHGVAQAMMGQARTALEAGKADEDLSTVLLMDQKTPGPALANDGAVLVPGLTIPGDFWVFVRHDPTCAALGCMEDYVLTRHCRAHTRVVYFKPYQMPPVLMGEVADPDPC